MDCQMSHQNCWHTLRFFWETFPKYPDTVRRGALSSSSHLRHLNAGTKWPFWILDTILNLCRISRIDFIWPRGHIPHPFPLSRTIKDEHLTFKQHCPLIVCWCYDWFGPMQYQTRIHMEMFKGDPLKAARVLRPRLEVVLMLRPLLLLNLSM